MLSTERAIKSTTAITNNDLETISSNNVTTAATISSATPTSTSTAAVITSNNSNSNCNGNNESKMSSTYSDSPWNIMKMLELIEQFRSQPVLWDQNNLLYKNKLSRSLAWDKIAENMKMEKYECEKKLNILRTQFRRECKKVKESAALKTSLYGPNGDGNGGASSSSLWYIQQQKESKWFAFKSMLFLIDGETNDKNTTTTSSSSLSRTCENQTIDYNSENLIKEEFVHETNSNEFYEDEYNEDGTTNTTTINRLQQYNENDEIYEESNLYITPDEIITTNSSNHHKEIINNNNNHRTKVKASSSMITAPGMKRKYNNTNHNDDNVEETNFHRNFEFYFKHNRSECLTFGEHIGYRLMRLPQRTRSIVMNIINNALFEADMGKFDS